MPILQMRSLGLESSATADSGHQCVLLHSELGSPGSGGLASFTSLASEEADLL